MNISFKIKKNKIEILMISLHLSSLTLNILLISYDFFVIIDSKSLNIL